MLHETLERTSLLSSDTAPLGVEENGGHAWQKAKLACQGHCHCGAVRFEVHVDPAAGTRKCNCSFCTRTRFWKVFVKATDFHLHSGVAELGEYRFGSAMVEHRFCKRCGTQVFMKADCVANEYVINVACLDEAARTLMSSEPLRFEDGRNDNWWSAPAETRKL